MELGAGVGLLLTASALGITHGIEPDHVAGIAALTHDAGDARLSALVGGCFAAGHAALVVLWIAIASLVVDAASFPPVFEQVGMLFVGVILSLLSLYLGVTGTRKLIHEHGHQHDDSSHSHYHFHVPLLGRAGADGHGDHLHEHGTVEYLKIGVVGALFTLSPPVSMIAFISVTMSQTPGPLVLGVVGAYTVSIIGTMAIIGGSAGSVFGLTKAKGEHVHAAFQVVAAVLILGFAANAVASVLPDLLL